MILTTHVAGVNLFCVDVVDTALADVEMCAAIKSDVAFDCDVMCGGVVGGAIGIDVRITDVDSYIIARGRDAVFIGRFTARGDLDRHIVWRCRCLAAHRAGIARTDKISGNSLRMTVVEGIRARRCWKVKTM